MYDVNRIRTLLGQHIAGHTLPQAFYQDPGVYQFELDAIFGRNWLQVALEVEIDAPGSWITVEIGASSVILLRDADGSVRGYYNNCRHRGARICSEAKGVASRFICPYHQWVYARNGQLIAAPQAGEGFSREAHGLRPVAVETVTGLIFVCLAESPPPFAEVRAALEPFLAPYELHRSKIAHRAVIREHANWKLAMENARECYHCRARHPELSRITPDVSSFYGESEPAWMTAFRSQCNRNGVSTGPVEGECYSIMRYPLVSGATSMTLDGGPAVSIPLGDPENRLLDGAVRWAMQPNTFNHAFRDYVLMFSAMPAGPMETLVTATWLVHKDAEEGRDYEKDRLVAVWNETNKQDVWLAENNQLGVNSRGYQVGPYVPEERPVRYFVEWYCQQLRSFLDESVMRR